MRPNETLFQAFKRQRDTCPEATAFMIAAGDRSVPITWAQFVRDIETVAYLIRTRAPGAKIGLLGENSYEWMTAHAACLFSGATVIPIEVGITAEEIAERLAFTGATVLVHSALHAEKARTVGKLISGLLVAGFGTRGTDVVLAEARTRLDAAGMRLFDLPERNLDETAAIVFTSGTTSKPRGAELTLRGMQTFAHFATQQLKLKAGDRSLMLLPLHHIFGICTTYAMLANGVSLGVCPDFRRIYDAMARFQAQYVCLVPALADILAAKIAQHGRSAEEAFGAPVDWALIGGAPLPDRTFEALKDLGIKPITIYGLTETTSLYSIAPVEGYRPGSAGYACGGFCGMETRVTSEGHVQVRGPAVMKGYFKEPERTAEMFTADGWFDTGDIGRIDADGFLWITGRRSRTIVLSSGKKVAPEELEEKILSIPGIREVLVSGDGASREVKAEVYAVVSEETVRRQIDALNRTLPVHKRIRNVVLRNDPFPRTSSGKISLSKAIAQAPQTTRPMVTSSVRISHRRKRMQVSFTLALVAAFVLALNFLPHALQNAGVHVPPLWLKLGEVFEESCEVFLALFAIFAHLVSTRIFSARDEE